MSLVLAPLCDLCMTSAAVSPARDRRGSCALTVALAVRRRGACEPRSWLHLYLPNGFTHLLVVASIVDMGNWGKDRDGLVQN